MEWSREARAIAAKMPEDGADWLPLLVHAADTAGVMLHLYENWLNEAGRQALADGLAPEEMRRLCRWLGFAHDLGKCTPAFQHKITEKNRSLRAELEQIGLSMPKNTANISLSPHALAGAALLLRAGENDALAAVIAAHHGKPWAGQFQWEDQFSSYGNNYDGNRNARESWRRVQREYMAAARRESGYAANEALPELSLAAQMLCTGLLIMADWIASNTDYFPLLPRGIDTADIPARLQAALARLALPPAWAAAPIEDSVCLCQTRFGFAPNAVQMCMIDAVRRSRDPGILILEAPMGIGKTEAALLTAESIAGRGIFFGLPTQATADGIFSRVEQWGQSQAEGNRATIRLAHGMAALNREYARLVDIDGESGVFVHEWMRGRKQALLSDFVVGTVDQALMAALCQKHVMLRHLGLCGKVVVIDECHAYDTHMNCYLQRMLRWLGAYRVPVIMLSATLPYARRAELVDAYLGKCGADGVWRTSQAYPLLTWTDGKMVKQQAIPLPLDPRPVEIERMTAAETVEEQALMLAKCLQTELAEGGCAAVVVNTVHRAQQMARILAQEVPQAHVMLLHAQFLMEDRKEREQALLQCVGKHSKERTRNGLIVVGTQVIEQSLDIDLDLLITDLCPMDLLLQRIGRLHRHRAHDSMRPERLRKARCLVIGAEGVLERGACAVYGEYLLMRTRALLPDIVRLPEDISPLVQAVYDADTPLPAYPAGYEKAQEQERLHQSKLRQKAQTFLLKEPNSSLDLTISEMMEVDVPPDDAHARAAVRSGDPGIEVLMLVRATDGSIRRVPWRAKGECWRVEEKPDEGHCRAIATQRIRLPGFLSRSKAVWEDLESRQGELAAWRESPWLRSEQLLLLDESLCVKLGGFAMRYTREWGFLSDDAE